MAGEIGIATQNFLYGRSVEEVVVELAAFSAKPRALLRGFAKVKIAAIAVVKEDSVRIAALQSDVKRNRLINWIAAFGVSGSVGIPVDE